MNKNEFLKWARRNANRIGVKPASIIKTFEKDMLDNKDINAPFEIPDTMRITMRYSYGGHSRFFREILEHKRLMGTKCNVCGKVFCPPRTQCPHCYEGTEWLELKGTGKILSYTTVYFGTSSYIKQVPYIVAYIRLDGVDTAILSNVEVKDIKSVKVGMRVKVMFRKQRDGRMTDFYFKEDI
ncbi:MAG: Zn-ribbon domain-containing OB-fold protein [Deltaproteobacteria bacterium]|nr:Zn-ribbon domain-containing OB-fold protein [Deltaproteobacteria bacterium]MCL5792240.1 Zn-ribbon domain-containing OB-fold protein [Deltaproteobacteria bacterium]